MNPTPKSGLSASVRVPSREDTRVPRSQGESQARVSQRRDDKASVEDKMDDVDVDAHQWRSSTPKAKADHMEAYVETLSLSEGETLQHHLLERLLLRFKRSQSIESIVMLYRDDQLWRDRYGCFRTELGVAVTRMGQTLAGQALNAFCGRENAKLGNIRIASQKHDPMTKDAVGTDVVKAEVVLEAIRALVADPREPNAKRDEFQELVISIDGSMYDSPEPFMFLSLLETCRLATDTEHDRSLYAARGEKVVSRALHEVHSRVRPADADASRARMGRDAMARPAREVLQEPPVREVLVQPPVRTFHVDATPVVLTPAEFVDRPTEWVRTPAGDLFADGVVQEWVPRPDPEDEGEVILRGIHSQRVPLVGKLMSKAIPEADPKPRLVRLIKNYTGEDGAHEMKDDGEGPEWTGFFKHRKPAFVRRTEYKGDDPTAFVPDVLCSHTRGVKFAEIAEVKTADRLEDQLGPLHSDVRSTKIRDPVYIRCPKLQRDKPWSYHRFQNIKLLQKTNLDIFDPTDLRNFPLVDTPMEDAAGEAMPSTTCSGTQTETPMEDAAPAAKPAAKSKSVPKASSRPTTGPSTMPTFEGGATPSQTKLPKVKERHWYYTDPPISGDRGKLPGAPASLWTNRIIQYDEPYHRVSTRSDWFSNFYLPEFTDGDGSRIRRRTPPAGWGGRVEQAKLLPVWDDTPAGHVPFVLGSGFRQNQSFVTLPKTFVFTSDAVENVDTRSVKADGELLFHRDADHGEKSYPVWKTFKHMVDATAGYGLSVKSAPGGYRGLAAASEFYPPTSVYVNYEKFSIEKEWMTNHPVWAPAVAGQFEQHGQEGVFRMMLRLTQCTTVEDLLAAGDAWVACIARKGSTEQYGGRLGPGKRPCPVPMFQRCSGFEEPRAPGFHPCRAAEWESLLDKFPVGLRHAAKVGLEAFDRVPKEEALTRYSVHTLFGLEEHERAKYIQKAQADGAFLGDVYDRCAAKRIASNLAFHLESKGIRSQAMTFRGKRSDWLSQSPRYDNIHSQYWKDIDDGPVWTGVRIETLSPRTIMQMDLAKSFDFHGSTDVRAALAKAAELVRALLAEYPGIEMNGTNGSGVCPIFVGYDWVKLGRRFSLDGVDGCWHMNACEGTIKHWGRIPPMLIKRIEELVAPLATDAASSKRPPAVNNVDCVIYTGYYEAQPLNPVWTLPFFPTEGWLRTTWLMGQLNWGIPFSSHRMDIRPPGWSMMYAMVPSGDGVIHPVWDSPIDRLNFPGSASSLFGRCPGVWEITEYANEVGTNFAKDLKIPAMTVTEVDTLFQNRTILVEDAVCEFSDSWHAWTEVKQFYDVAGMLLRDPAHPGSGDADMDEQEEDDVPMGGEDVGSDDEHDEADPEDYAHEVPAYDLQECEKALADVMPNFAVDSNETYGENRVRASRFITDFVEDEEKTLKTLAQQLDQRLGETNGMFTAFEEAELHFDAQVRKARCAYYQVNALLNVEFEDARSMAEGFDLAEDEMRRYDEDANAGKKAAHRRSGEQFGEFWTFSSHVDYLSRLIPVGKCRFYREREGDHLTEQLKIVEKERDEWKERYFSRTSPPEA